MSQFDREELSDPQKTELRRGLTNDAIAKAMQAEIEVMRSAIATIRQLLLIQGLCVTDVFHELRRETSFTAEETLIAPRVRTDERRGTPNFYWERTIRHAYPLGTTPIAKREGRARNYQAFVRRHGSKTKTKMHVIPVVQARAVAQEDPKRFHEGVLARTGVGSDGCGSY